MQHASEGMSTGSRVDEIKDRGWYAKIKFVGRLLARDRAGALGLIMFLIIVLSAVFATQLAPHNPLKQNLRQAKKPPAWSEKGSAQYPLGTDNLGRDLLSRIIYGTRVSVTVGFFGVLIAGSLGLVIGLISGYVGGRVDNAIM